MASAAGALEAVVEDEEQYAADGEEGQAYNRCACVAVAGGDGCAAESRGDSVAGVVCYLYACRA